VALPAFEIVHRQRGDVARAELARFLWPSYLTIPFSLGFAVLADMGHSNPTPFGLVLALCVLVLVNPLATPFLVGTRAPAFDVVTPAYPPARAAKSAVRGLVPVGVLAASLLVASVALHLSRCDGTLVTLAEPKTAWRSLPVVADGDARSIGAFKLRGYTTAYKTYPSGTAAASLVDPRLCFASTVSLSAWFDDGMESMYRSLAELRLRHDARTDVWIVSGARRTERPDEFVAAFRRELGRRFAFDYQASALYPACGGVLLVMFRKRSRDELAAGRLPRFVLAALAYACFLGALAAPILLEAMLAGHPRPGAELAVEVILP
jgi:hypothetical protein